MTVYQMINLVGVASSATNNTAKPEYVTLPYEKFFSLLLVISILILVVGVVLLIVLSQNRLNVIVINTNLRQYGKLR